MGKELVKRDEAAMERRKRLQAQFLEFMLQSGKLDYREAAHAFVKDDDRKHHKARLWMKRWRRWMRTDEDFQAMVGAICMAELRSGIPLAVEALNRRAAKGNVPAIKLAMEASGFHNPRTTHEHVGEIAITLKGLTRPPSVIDDDAVVDADVVDGA